MRTVQKFLNFVEIRTKIASVLPFLTGLTYVFYLQHRIQLYHTLLFFVAMLLFDMTTTAINNYIDARHAKQTLFFSNGTSIAIILGMLLCAMILGLYLTYLCGLVVLAVGVFCFFVGIVYTFGPVPISRTPYGELFSGAVMGFCIPFLIVYVNLPNDQLVQLISIYPELNVRLSSMLLLRLCVVCIPLVVCISNIMLANNICDLVADIQNKRYTLPYYIGVSNAIKLFASLYGVAYLFIFMASMVNIVPKTTLLTLLTIIPVYKNIHLFRKKQSKKETFAVSISNLIWITLSYAVTIGIGA